jgi:hypothetical protein
MFEIFKRILNDDQGETSTLHLFNEVPMGDGYFLLVFGDTALAESAADFSIYQDTLETLSGAPTSRGEGETAALKPICVTSLTI